MIFMSFKSNTTGVTSGERTAKPSRVYESCSYVCGGLVLLIRYDSVLCILDHRLSFFLWLLHCLSFDLRLLITPLVSSNFYDTH